MPTVGVTFSGGKASGGTSVLTPFTKATPFTIEAWLRCSNATTFQALVSSQMTGASGKGIQLGFNNDGRIILRIQGVLRLERASTGSLATGAWEHIAVTYSGSLVGSGIQLIRNGVDASGTISHENDPGDMTTTNPTQLGSRHTAEIPYDGDIRDVRIWRGMQVHPGQVAALKDTLTLPSIPILFDAHASKFASIASQGVATDGTHIYATDSTTVKKYDLTGTEVDTHAHGIAGFQYEDPTVVSGVLYIPLTNYTTTPRVGKIQKLNTSDLTVISTTDLTEAIWPAAIAHRGGEFWVSVTEDASIYRYNASFVLQNTYTFPVYGTQAPTWPGYSGLEWIGDYLYANKHEGSERGLDVALWSGTAFSAVGACRHVSSGTTQGLTYDVTNSRVYWAARGHSNQVWESQLTGGLIAHWKMDEGSGTSLADVGKTPADTATLSGSYAWFSEGGGAGAVPAMVAQYRRRHG